MQCKICDGEGVCIECGGEGYDDCDFCEDGSCSECEGEGEVNE